MYKYIVVILMLLLYHLPLLGQSNIEDTLALIIANQSYLKLQDAVDCSSPFTTTIERRICANLEFQRMNNKLNDLVAVMVSDFKKYELLEENKVFLRQQQEWIWYRDVEAKKICGAFRDMDLISEKHLQTLIELTQKRIDILSEVLTD
jgi:uncharacterized protein YecT (DUF1311 family)